jgi:GNAT superfamily N-acetyltransferase
VSIRAATPADARGIAGVHVAAWKIGYRDLLPQVVLDAQSIDEREETWHGFLTDDANDVRTIVAEDSGDITGFISIIGVARDDDARPGTAEIPALYVHPMRWRNEIGMSLMLVALSALRASEAIDVTLWVIEDNERARAFYARCGFKDDGAVKQNQFGVREVRLRLTL